MSAAKLIKMLYKQSEYEKMVTLVVDQMLSEHNDAERKAMVDFLSEHISIEKVEEGLIGIYSDYFLESEIEQLIEFYNTLIGQKCIHVGPKLGLDVMNFIHGRIMDNIDNLNLSNEIVEDQKDEE